MPRVPRIEYENAIYHVLARGDRREPIVQDDTDRKLFLTTLGQACEKSGWELFAWVLMDNHYHLALRTPQANLVEGMTWLQNTFTRRINVRHRQWGHLFGGRYKAIVVEPGQGGYLTTLVDYIHLNPGRAGLVDGLERSVGDYPWSSVAGGYARPPSKRPRWLAVEEGLDLFGERDHAKGRRRFVERIDERITLEKEEAGLEAGESQSLQSTLRRGWYWGSESFRESLLERFGEEARRRRNRDDRSSGMMKDHGVRDAERIIGEACRHYGMEEAELIRPRRGDRKRASVASRIWRETNVTQGWLAERLGLRTPANVSQTIRRFESLTPNQLGRKVRKWRDMSNVVD